MTVASARIIAAVSAEASYTVQPHSVCRVLNNVVRPCVLFKSLVSVYFRCPAKLWVSLEDALLVCITNQAENTSTADLLARWEHEMTTARWSRAQGGGPSVIPTAGIHCKLRGLLT